MVAPSIIDLRRLAAATTAVAAASAFRSAPSPITIKPSTSTSAWSSRRESALAAARHNYFHPPFPFPFPDPYFDPFYQNHPYYQNMGPNGPFYPPRGRMDPRFSAPLDVEAEVIEESEADELLEEQRKEKEDWTTDRERARKKKGEVIDFDRPLKSAAAYPSDDRFQGRKPGQAVNGSDRRGDEDHRRDGRDPREQHVVMDEYDEFMNGFFHQRPPPYGPPPQRPGPSVYTREEEDLIEAMGGRGPRSTQEFAGLGTMSKDRGAHGEVRGDPQQMNYNPEQNYAPPEQQQPFAPPMPPMPDMPPMGGFREEGFLGDSTLKEISMDYSVPVPYLADVLATWGAPVPIDPSARLGDMVTGEQAFAILEAIHTLDVAALHERYSEDTLVNICDYYDIDLKEAFEFCVEGRGWALPFGVRTFLRVEQEEELLDALCGEGVY